MMHDTADTQESSKPQLSMRPGFRQRGIYRRFSYFRVAAFALFAILFFYSFLRKGTDKTMVTQSKVGGECDPPYVEYSLDDEFSNDRVMLYTAQHRATQCEKFDETSMQPLSVEQWIRYMSGDHSQKLALELTNLITESPFRGLRFETKGVTDESAKDVPFEFALVNDDGLYNFASDADPNTFAEKLKTCPDNLDACAFSNLRGDAKLVSPKNEGNGDKNRYGHLAAFLRKAPTAQIQEVWKLAAETYKEQLTARSPNPVWFSTAGGGVSWLHFRFDTRPKYYHYSPFKNEF